MMIQNFSETHQVFNQDGFTSAFVADLQRARGLVLIQSPFLSPRRINELAAPLRSCVDRGVRVCVVAQSASEKPAIGEEQIHRAERFSIAQETLASLKIHLTFRSNVHEKLAVIDESIFWEGSLNILSFNKSFERMTRWVGRSTVNDALNMHKLFKCDICEQLIAKTVGLDSEKVSVRSLAYLGAAAKQRRLSLGLTQRDLSSLARVQQAQVSNLESGTRPIRLDSLLNIYQQLGLSLMPTPDFAVPAVTAQVFQPDDITTGLVSSLPALRKS